MTRLAAFICQCAHFGYASRVIFGSCSWLGFRQSFVQVKHEFAAKATFAQRDARTAKAAAGDAIEAATVETTTGIGAAVIPATAWTLPGHG